MIGDVTIGDGLPHSSRSRSQRPGQTVSFPGTPTDDKQPFGYVMRRIPSKLFSPAV